MTDTRPEPSANTDTITVTDDGAETGTNADTDDGATTTDTAAWWWTLVALNLAVFAALFVRNETALAIPPSLEWVQFLLGTVALTAPAVVAIAVHFDRKFVAAVSDWNPRSEYILLGVAMWVGIGVPLAVLYLYRRRQYVGVP
ncbi:hypothetical protein [Halorussus aquaticus]|uniref:Phospholipase_D-nuclease N-terminal n=1 Tax=Halorussus aquaticus TaxID=2953748 RepID=A0ABD5Q4L5_9EURY|nr:hypothetical protein [Halorussus aquaticus]